MVSQRVLRVWLFVGLVLAVTAALGWWLSRPDTSRWGRDDGIEAAGQVTQQEGDGECAGLALLDIQPAAGLSVAGTFVRDDEGVLDQEALARHFARANGSLRRYGPEASLPEGAVETPWRRGDDAVLWLAPDDDDYAFVAGDRVEAWPRAEDLACAAGSVG